MKEVIDYLKKHIGEDFTVCDFFENCITITDANSLCNSKQFDKLMRFLPNQSYIKNIEQNGTNRLYVTLFKKKIKTSCN